MPRHHVNPAFDPSPEAVKAGLARLSADAQPLARPVVFLAGYRAPGFSILAMQRQILKLTSQRPADFIVHSYPGAGTVEAAFNSADPRIRAFLAQHGASEVDIVALSMGGLIARALACNLYRSPDPIRIRNIFTLSTPHQGAILADYVRPDSAARDLRRGSDFLSRLNVATGCPSTHSPASNYSASLNGQAAPAPAASPASPPAASLPTSEAASAPKLLCYALLHDWWVGATRTAPPGHPILWRDTFGMLDSMFSHFMVTRNRAIALDIALRLRNQPPIAYPGDPPPID